MVRVGISVEGPTEERFVERILQPHLGPKNIFVTPVLLDGNVSLDRIGHELNKLMYSFDVVTTFYDFYGFKKKQDGATKASLEAHILKSISERVQYKKVT